ncbi:hypothetical protein BBP40_008914 [Aspergillus hancockii]|nr:hypothetical protein BBP40_008914 [Aspergillus hancockii]
MADRYGRLPEDLDPYWHLRYLPPPQQALGTHQYLYHPKPIRQIPSPPYLSQGAVPSIAYSPFSVREGLFGSRDLSPGARHFAAIQSQMFAREQVPRVMTENVYWRFGDPIPQGWRVTVTPHVVNSPRPNQHHILVPECDPPESYARRREIPLSLLLCDEPDRTVVEHATILHNMKHPGTVAGPINELSTMPRFPTGGGDSPSPADNPDPVDTPTPHSPKEATDPKLTSPSTHPDDLPVPLLTQAAVMLVEFEELTTHTAKCDLCNKRNATGMSRCLTCGWQSCHACTIASGCFRTHHINGNIHTGPISREDLAAAARNSPKTAKKKAKLSTQKKHALSQFKQASKSKNGRAIKKPKVSKRTSQSSPVAGKVGGDQKDGAEEDDRNIRDDCDEWDLDSLPDGDTTESLPDEDRVIPWTPLNAPLSQDDLHRYALQQTSRACEEMGQKKSTGKKYEAVAGSSKVVARSNAAAHKQSVKTKAQVYSRKQPGRYLR